MSWSLSPTSGKKLHVLLEGSSSSSWWLGGWRPPQDVSRCCCWFVSSFHHSDERVKVRSFSSSWNCSLRSLSLNRSFELLDHTSGVISFVCALPSSQNATALSRAAIIVAVVALSKLPSSTLGLLYVCHRFTAALSRWKRLCFNITLLYTPKLPQHTLYTWRFAVLKLCLPLDGADEPDPAAGMCLFIWCVCVCVLCHVSGEKCGGRQGCEGREGQRDSKCCWNDDRSSGQSAEEQTYHSHG